MKECQPSARRPRPSTPHLPADSAFSQKKSCLLLEDDYIQYLFPPQNTLFDAADGSYRTQIDRQVGDSDEERKSEKACIPKQTSQSESDGGEETPVSETENADGFTDNSPLNGTIVDDPMEVKIYKPECDD
uniref:Uncharacterized protein n=1 Tax=Caenorhabditis japonica TaxID=281687 RepID=A0A8R1DX26_CAEJA